MNEFSGNQSRYSTDKSIEILPKIPFTLFIRCYMNVQPALFINHQITLTAKTLHFLLYINAMLWSKHCARDRFKVVLIGAWCVVSFSLFGKSINVSDHFFALKSLIYTILLKGHIPIEHDLCCISSMHREWVNADLFLWKSLIVGCELDAHLLCLCIIELFFLFLWDVYSVRGAAMQTVYAMSEYSYRTSSFCWFIHGNPYKKQHMNAMQADVNWPGSVGGNVRTQVVPGNWISVFQINISQ